MSSDRPKRPWVGLVIRVSISLALLVLLFREHELTSTILPKLGLLRDNWAWTGLGILCAGVSAWLTAWRWWLLMLPQIPGVTLRTVSREIFVSLFFNITSLGVAGGDAYKIIAMGRRFPEHKLPVAITVMLDHIVGFFAVAVLFLGCISLTQSGFVASTGEIQTLLRGFAWLLGGSAVFLLANIVLCAPKMRAWGEPRLPWLLKRPYVQRMGDSFDGLRRHWRHTLMATGVSAVMTLLFFFSFYCGIRAVGGTTPVLDVMIAMPIVDMVAALPISVSGLGVREKTFETLLTAFSSIPEATAISASLAGWLFSLFWGLAGGVLFLRRS